jgi:hypothetical protein
LKFDSATGALALDEAFHDADGKPGFNFADRDWPHGWKDRENRMAWCFRAELSSICAPVPTGVFAGR